MGKEVPVLKSNVKLNNVRKESDQWVKIGNQRVSKETINQAKAKGYTDDEINAIIRGENVKSMQKEFVDHSVTRNTNGNVAASKSKIMNKYDVSSDEFDKEYDSYVKSGGLTKDAQHKVIYNEASKYRDNGKKDSDKQAIMQKYGLSSDEFDQAYNDYYDVWKVQRKQKAEEKAKEDAEWAKNHKGLALAESVFDNVFLKPAETVTNLLATPFTHIDESDFIVRNRSDALREGIVDGIDNELGKKAANLGMGLLDMAGQVGVSALSGGGSTAIGLLQGAGTGGDMMKQSLENGNSQGEAATKGLLGGALGFAMGKKGIDLVKETGSVIPSILAKSASEGAEEFLESKADRLIDNTISKITGSTSNEQALAEQFMAQGYSEKDAKKMASDALNKQDWTNAAYGSALGGLMGGMDFATGRADVSNSVVKDLIQKNPDFKASEISNARTVPTLTNSSKSKAKATSTSANADIKSTKYSPDTVKNVFWDEIKKYGQDSANASGYSRKSKNKAIKDVIYRLVKESNGDITKNEILDGLNSIPDLRDNNRNGTFSNSIGLSRESMVNNVMYDARAEYDTNRNISYIKKPTQFQRNLINIGEPLVHKYKGDIESVIDSLNSEYRLLLNNDKAKAEFDKVAKYLTSYAEAKYNKSVNTEATPQKADATAPNTMDSDYGNLYDSITRENLGTGISRKDTTSQIFKTGKKSVNKGTMQNLTETIRQSMNDETFKGSKELRLELNKAIREHVEQGTQATYDKMMNIANQVAEMLPESNDMNPGATRGEFLAQLGYISETPEIVMNMDVENALDIIYDRNTSSQEKIDAWFNVVNKYGNNENFNRYSDTLVNAENFIRELTKAPNTDVTSESIPTESNTASTNTDVTTNNLTTPDPQIGNGDKRTRGYYESVDLPEDFKTQLNDKIYNQLSNTETYEKALKVREEASSINDAVSKFREMLGRHEAASVPLGYNLAQELIDAGEMSAATDIVNDIMSQMTKAGQFTQAAYLTALKNNPLAAMTALEKEIKKLNDAGSKKIKNWKELKLTDAEKQALSSVKTGDAETLNNVMDSIYDRLAEDYQFSKWDKFYDLTKTFMLLNPRTHIRNTGANMISTPLRSLTDRTKAGLESVYSLFNKDYQRTSSFKGGNPEQKAIATEVAKTAFNDDVDDKWLNSAKGQIESRAQLWKDGKNGDKVKERALKRAEKTASVVSSIDEMVGGKLSDLGLIDAIDNHIQNNITGSRLENMRQFDYLLLGDIEDEPFVRQNFVNALANYMAAQDIHSAEDIPAEAIQLAKNEALKATFKDDNFLTKALSGLKKSPFNQKTHFFDVLMPFTKTPANLAMRGLEYSPAGFAKSIIEFNKLKSSGDITNADISNFIGELAKNTTGTAMMAVGYLLAKNGIITGEYDDNQNARNFQKMQGYKEYAFKLGDKYVTYDWAQPTSIPLIIGTAIYEGTKDSEDSDNPFWDTLGSVKNGMINAADAWFNLSPLQNLSEVLKGGNTYGDTSIAKNIADKMLEYPQTLIPSVLGATARTVDPTMRNTTDVTSDAKTYLNQVLAKIPGASLLLPASYDTWGEERKRDDSVGGAAVSQYLNPATTGYYNESNSDIDDYIQGIYDATGEDTVFPKTAEYSVVMPDGETKKLNNEEFSERQKVQGQKQAELVRAFSQIADSQGLSKSEQADALSKIYSAAKDSAKEELYDIESSMSDTEYGIFKEGPEAYAQYQVDKQMAKRYDLDYKKYKELYDEGGIKAVESYAQKKAQAKGLSDQYGIDMNTSSIETAEKNGQTAEEYAQRTARVKEINKQYGLDMEKSTYDSYLDKGANDDQIVFIENMKSEIKKARPSSEKKNTSLKQSEVISYLEKSNLSDSEKSAIIKYSLNPDSGYVKRGLSTFGDSALYQIMLNKVLADSEEYGGNEDGSVSQAEAKAFIATLPKSERQSWYYVLIGK